MHRIRRPTSRATAKQQCRLAFAALRAIAFGLLFVSHAFSSLNPSTAMSQYVRQSWPSDATLQLGSITALAQTPDGYIWFGTEQGLARFDGNHFFIYDKSNTPALGNSCIRSLLMDRAGTLWIGSTGGSLTGFRSGKFFAFERQRDLPDSAITALFADRDGALWIGTSGSGLFVDTKGAVRRISTHEGLPGDFVYAIKGTNTGEVWVGTQSGAAKISGSRVTTLTVKDGLLSNWVHAIDLVGDTVWLGTEKGLSRLDKTGVHNFSQRDGLTSNTVTALLRDGAGTLWIGTLGGGLDRFAGDSISGFPSNDELQKGGIWALLEDHAGTLWIGRTQGGPTYLRQGPFTSISSRDGLPSDTATAVFEDRDHSLWIGSDRGLAVSRGAHTQTFTVADGLPDNLVLSIGQDSAGSIWVSTHGGLARLNGGHFQRFDARDGLPADNMTLCLYTDRHGAIWAGSRGALSRFDGRRFASYTSRDGLAPEAIISLYQSADDSLWIGTDGGGLIRFRDGKFVRFGARDGLTNDSVWSISGDADGSLWLGTHGGGLLHYAGGVFTTYTRAQGLGDDDLFEVLDDGKGRLWLTSNRGVFSVEKAALLAHSSGKPAVISATKYGPVDGLQDRECNGGFQPAGWRLSDGRLSFPTMKGVAVVDPLHLPAPELPFAPLVEAVTVGHRPIAVQKAIVIPPGTHDVEFHFTAPYFGDQEKIEFKYLLEGFDLEWVNAGSRRAAYYTNLPPAEYRFLIAACVGNTCSETAEPMQVHLMPGFYETKSFAFTVVTLVGTLIFALHRVRVRQLQVREVRLRMLIDERTHELRESRDQLEGRVQERTSELSLANEQLQSEIAVRREAEQRLIAASNAKSQFLANMSHEIRTPINGIMGMAELLSCNISDHEDVEYLDTLKGCASDLLRVVNSILDYSSMESGRLEIESEPFQLSGCIGPLYRSVSLAAKDKGLAFKISVSDDVPDRLVGDGRRLAQLLLNLLENAVKFTVSGSIALSIGVDALTTSSVRLRFNVQDTGIGIPEDKQPMIFKAFSQVDTSNTRQFGGTGLGLTICDQLVTLMDGKIAVESTPGKGSKFSFSALFGLDPTFSAATLAPHSLVEAPRFPVA